MTSPSVFLTPDDQPNVNCAQDVTYFAKEREIIQTVNSTLRTKEQIIPEFPGMTHQNHRKSEWKAKKLNSKQDH